MKHIPEEGFYPPLDVVRHNPTRDGLLETPVDNRGLVDFSKLIEIVNDTIEPTYSWPPCPKRPKVKDENLHHLYWPNKMYSIEGDDSLHKQFRELDTSKAVLPVRFHNWLHRVTAPPPMPSDEVCYYRIEADRVVHKLFKCAQYGTQVIKKESPSKRAKNRLIRKLDLYATTLEEMKYLPEEFLQINPDEYIVNSPEDILIVAPRLGKLASHHSLSETTRIIKQIKVA